MALLRLWLLSRKALVLVVGEVLEEKWIWEKIGILFMKCIERRERNVGAGCGAVRRRTDSQIGRQAKKQTDK